jgi:hypothetical protein
VAAVSAAAAAAAAAEAAAAAAGASREFFHITHITVANPQCGLQLAPTTTCETLQSTLPRWSALVMQQYAKGMLACSLCLWAKR